MPTYNYVCSKCGHDFQRVERISEQMKARPRFPKCKSTKVKRVFTAAFVKTVKKS